MPRDVPRILLTGDPLSGKTTFVCRLVRDFLADGVVVQGFTTREIREQDHRVGFLAEAIGGDSAVIAHVARADGPQVGRYHVDIRAFESVALPALDRVGGDCGVAVIDEIGQMELYSDAFVRAVQRLFEQEIPLVATVHARTHPVTDALKRQPGVRLLTLTRDTHEELLAQVTAQLLGGPAGTLRSSGEPRREL
jgi:nucleoside-triphosphatase